VRWRGWKHRADRGAAVENPEVRTNVPTRRHDKRVRGGIHRPAQRMVWTPPLDVLSVSVALDPRISLDEPVGDSYGNALAESGIGSTRPS